MSETGRVSHYGIHERESPGDAVALCAERIRLIGYTVLPSGFSAPDVAELGRRLDHVLERQVAECGGADRLALIGDAFTARCLLAYDDAFLRIASHPPLLAVCRQLLGDYIILMQQNGIVNPSGEPHRQTAYHRDLPYQHFVSSRPLAISALFCLDPFVSDTGATTVVPGSHRVERFPSDAVLASLETPIEAEAGAFIVFDSMLFHRAGTNRSEFPRRAINQVFSVPIIAQQISLPAALGGRYLDDPPLARLLGYEVAPAASASEWRERRLKRTVRHHD